MNCICIFIESSNAMHASNPQVLNHHYVIDMTTKASDIHRQDASSKKNKELMLTYIRKRESFIICSYI